MDRLDKKVVKVLLVLKGPEVLQDAEVFKV